MNWHFPDRSVLVVGIGGGSDIIAAYALSTMITGARKVAYGNTKPRASATPSQPHGDFSLVRKVTDWQPAPHQIDVHGTANIDHTVPRGADGCPFLFILEEGEHDALTADIGRMGYDLIVAVDIGGDSLYDDPRAADDNRDLQMLEVLERTGIDLIRVVLAPGIDGETPDGALDKPMQTRVLERFSLEPLHGILKEYGENLKPSRTPNLIHRAANGELEEVTPGRVRVPRYQEPTVPLEWLLHGYVMQQARRRVRRQCAFHAED